MTRGAMPRRPVRAGLVVVLMIASLVVPLAGPAAANHFQFSVDSVLDLPDAAPGDGSCDTPGPGLQCTLRAAFMEMSALPSTAGHVVLVPPGVYALTLPGDSPGGSDGDLDVLDAGFTLRLPPGAIGTVTIDASAIGDRALDISTVHPVRLENIAIIGGHSTLPAGVTNRFGSSGGGLRHVRGALTIVNGTFSDNVADDDGWGGALLVRDADLDLQNVTFIENRTLGFVNSPWQPPGPPPGPGGGGALFFERTSAGAPPGPTRANITGGTFRGNSSADGNGGAIAVDAPGGRLNLSAVTFDANTAPEGDGGAVHLQAFSGATITDSTFRDNAAADDGTGNGGAVRLLDMVDATAAVKVATSTFTGNTANTGGAISVGSGSSLEVTASTFEGNTAAAAPDPQASFPSALPTCGCGGAISAVSGDLRSDLTITGGVFRGNIAGDLIDDGGAGGAVHVDGAGVSISGNPVIEDNEAGDSGGGLFLRSHEVGVSDAVIRRNTAGGAGGGVIVAARDAQVGGTTPLSRLVVSQNVAGRGGGIGVAASVAVTDSKITGNRAIAGGGGGVLHLEGGLHLERVEINGNRASANGGGLLQQPGPVGPSVLVDLPVAMDGVDVEVDDNEAVGAAGGLLLFEGANSLERFSTSGNRSVTSIGGALVVLGPGSLEVESAAFDDNYTGEPRTRDPAEDTAIGGAGGALIALDATVTVRNASILRNHSQGFGAAVIGTSGSIVNLENVTISANTTDAAFGAGISMLAGSRLNSSYVTIAFNEADILDDLGEGVGSALHIQSASVDLYQTLIACNFGAACSFSGLDANVNSFTSTGSIYDEDEEGGNRVELPGELQSCEQIFVAATWVNDSSLLRESLRRGLVFVPHDRIGLNGLRLNGGRTLTHSLRLRSPAIDLNINGDVDRFRALPAPTVGGTPAGAPLLPDPADAPDGPNAPCRTDAGVVLDQRGFTRPRDGNGDARFCPDVGAYEFVQGAEVTEVARATEVGPSGPENGLLRFTRQGDLTESLEVDYTISGTATPGEDYIPLTGLVVFAPGVEVVFVTIRPIADDVVEEPETISVTIQNRLRYSLGAQSRATIELHDADSGVTVTATDPTASEVGNDTGTFTFTRGGATSEALEIFYRVTGTATSGLDYEPLPETITFPPGERTVDLVVDPIEDSRDDPGETVTVTIDQDPTYIRGLPFAATVRIVDSAPVVLRLAGDDRIDTAIAVSNAIFADDGAAAAVIARSDLFPDALSGGPFARSVGGPILLTKPDALDGRVEDELRRLGVTSVYLLGGRSALSDTIIKDIRNLGIADVERIGGDDRFETAALVAERVIGDGTLAYIVEGQDEDPLRGWPDAVSASGLASFEQRPILLVPTERVPQPTRDAIRDLGVSQIRIVGGPVAVSNAVQSELAGPLGLAVERIAGSDRFETSRAVAEIGVAAGLDPQITWLSTGALFPDALVAGPAAAAEGGVLLLVNDQELDRSEATRAWLEGLSPQGLIVRLVGGIAAISAQVEAEIRTLIGI